MSRVGNSFVMLSLIMRIEKVRVKNQNLFVLVDPNTPEKLAKALKVEPAELLKF